MTALEATETTDRDPLALPETGSTRQWSIALQAMPHVLVWGLLLVPTIRSMVRGWRPLGDDAALAIGAWRSISLHPPLIGTTTGATGAAGTSDPGPLQFWLLGPFVHIDPGEGMILGAAVLCAAILSLTLRALWRTTGPAAAVIFSLTVADLAIVSPTPFIDPVWNSDFGFFWFLAFLGLAFVVGQGNVTYIPLLVFVASVTVDAHLMFLPAVILVLVGTVVSGLLLRRSRDLRWLWLAAAVALFCWIGPLYQEFFESHPNLSALLDTSGFLHHDHTRTDGFVYGLRALSRAVSPNPVWASPRPIDPLIAAADVGHRSLLLCLVIPALVAIAVVAWRQKRRSLVSMCVVSVGAGIGVVALFSRIPYSFLLSYSWTNLALWPVGICIWLTFGLAAVTAYRSRFAETAIREPGIAVNIAAIGCLAAATVAGSLVAVFPYQTQFVTDWAGVNRIKAMTASIERRVPMGAVGLGIRYSGSDYFQSASDERGSSYLLLAAGWVPGMEPATNGTLGLPIHPRSPFVVITEHGTQMTAIRFYKRYKVFWWVTPSPQSTPAAGVK